MSETPRDEHAGRASQPTTRAYRGKFPWVIKTVGSSGGSARVQVNAGWWFTLSAEECNFEYPSLGDSIDPETKKLVRQQKDKVL